jgi:transposase
LQNIKKMHRAIQKKKRGMLTPGVVLLYDNARPHTAGRTGALLEHFKLGHVCHPTYSPDLAPSDYHLFTYLKNCLGSQRCNNTEELIEGVKTWLSSQACLTCLPQEYKNLFPDRQVPQIRR